MPKRSRIKLGKKEYKLLCIQVLQRDGYKCRIPYCPKRETLQCHHIIFRQNGGDDAPWNLITVCAHCHDAIHLRFCIIKPKDGILNADSKQYVIEFVNNWRPGKVLK